MHVNLLTGYGPAAEKVSGFSQRSPVLPKGRERKPLEDRWSFEYVGQPAGFLAFSVPIETIGVPRFAVFAKGGIQ